jgi:probable F420-dependent oxidoreductase
VKFGFQTYPWHRWGELHSIVDVVLHAEQCGFDAVALPDHIVAPAHGDGPSLGSVWPDVYLMATHLGALTSRIRLQIYASVIPYRPVIQQAKAIATLDNLCSGRLVVVAGTGWCREEFEALGLSFADRGAITDEYLHAMRQLWTTERPSFQGQHVTFGPVKFSPKCFQQPHVPIWIAGSGKRPMRRLVEYGTGWAPMVGDMPTLTRDIALAKQQLATAGRSPDTVEFSFGLSYGDPDDAVGASLAHLGEGARTVSASTVQQTIEQVCAYQAAGVTQLIVSTAWQTSGDLRRRLEWFADNVIRELPPSVAEAAT